MQARQKVGTSAKQGGEEVALSTDHYTGQEDAAVPSPILSPFLAMPAFTASEKDEACPSLYAVTNLSVGPPRRTIRDDSKATTVPRKGGERQGEAAGTSSSRRLVGTGGEGVG